jgi:hypothetical protein
MADLQKIQNVVDAIIPDGEDPGVNNNLAMVYSHSVGKAGRSRTAG